MPVPADVPRPAAVASRPGGMGASPGRPERARRWVTPLRYPPGSARRTDRCSAGSTYRRSRTARCRPVPVDRARGRGQPDGLPLAGTPVGRFGVSVLRFDYHGTGDSTGNHRPRSGGRVDGGHRGCLDYLRSAGAARLHLVGTRLGATLAARAASEDGFVESLTLWYPWTKGSQFLRYQRALRRLYAVSDDPSRATAPPRSPGSSSTPMSPPI